MRPAVEALHASGEKGFLSTLAREALAVTEGSDYLQQIGDVCRTLGNILELSGRGEEATAAFERALASYEAKGDVVDATRTRELLASLGEGS